MALTIGTHSSQPRLHGLDDWDSFSLDCFFLVFVKGPVRMSTLASWPIIHWLVSVFVFFCLFDFSYPFMFVVWVQGPHRDSENMPMSAQYIQDIQLCLGHTSVEPPEGWVLMLFQLCCSSSLKWGKTLQSNSAETCLVFRGQQDGCIQCICNCTHPHCRAWPMLGHLLQWDAQALRETCWQDLKCCYLLVFMWTLSDRACITHTHPHL